ncbi:hypothetical protein CBOM_03172 [Ceraceosorus bombacis]|uniref:Uncharacterized protein n=1 Tax=Ceraceosorus bombacis TaxID=401625 RepID=A0A0P1BL96_9BASI|nr:hypothetical protein CBOM_03172 [Ceraceosorus bombacis]
MPAGAALVSAQAHSIEVGPESTSSEATWWDGLLKAVPKKKRIDQTYHASESAALQQSSLLQSCISQFYLVDPSQPNKTSSKDETLSSDGIPPQKSCTFTNMPAHQHLPDGNGGVAKIQSSSVGIRAVTASFYSRCSTSLGSSAQHRSWARVEHFRGDLVGWAFESGAEEESQP